MPQYAEDFIRRARKAKSPQELASLAEENGTPISEARASELYDRVCGVGEIAEDELDSVVGGCSNRAPRTCQWCGGTISIYPDGDYCDDCGRRF